VVPKEGFGARSDPASLSVFISGKAVAELIPMTMAAVPALHL
jgi:hypothetical protein